MDRTPANGSLRILASTVLLACPIVAFAQAADGDAARLKTLEDQVQAQRSQIESLQRLLSEQQAQVDALDKTVQDSQLQAMRARGTDAAPIAGTPATAAVAAAGVAGAIPSEGSADAEEAAHRELVAQQSAQASGQQQHQEQEQVGQAPESSTRPPEIAQIFDQPGVLTPSGKFILEPSMQLGYWANDRVALVGYTVIPAILIGLIDVRQVKTTAITAALAARYGVNNRLELELKVPYLYINADTVSREIFTGSAQDKVFSADGHGAGDIEMTARYQLNKGAPDKPYYVGWLRYKSRTGVDLFDVVTDCVTRCVANATGTGLPLQLAVGSGFASLQPGVTWLFASDPVVFFGSFSYLYNFPREDVSRRVLSGAPEPFPPTTTEYIGEVAAGDVLGFNVGMGLALNEKASISMGYDHSMIGKTQQNGEDLPGSVRVMLGTLLLGASYRFNDRATLNFALGVGVTRDTPDLTLAVRLPITF